MALFIDGEYIPQPNDGVTIVSESVTVRVGETKIETHADAPIEVELALKNDGPKGWFK